MCTKLCLCNLCKKNACDDCPYIELQKDMDCNIGGVKECDYFIGHE